MKYYHIVAVNGVRARAREAVRAQVTAVVVELVLERGFDETTIDDICAAAEISRSTFFRYFPTKEDALFGGVSDAGERLLEALVARPSDEAPWAAMRQALAPIVDQYEGHDERTRQLVRLVVNTPVLAARHREKNARWHQLLRPEIARRLGADPADLGDPRPDAVIAAALGCVEATLIVWTAEGQTKDLTNMLDSAMGAIGPA